ncbi:MAG: DNA repair protein RadC [Lactobacillales bacterium]|jgi:DNA repair protein RadC|nr:DNA repair protein RadC [Lactobacillales bacterium]
MLQKNQMYEVYEEESAYLPRERMEKYGEKMLSNQELLALILRTGTKEESVYALAQRVLEVFPNLYAFKSASLEEFQAIKGIGKAKSIELKAVIEFGRRIQLANQEFGEKVCSSYSLGQRLIQELKDYPQEHFIAIFLNTKNQIIRQKTLFVGSLNHSIAHPREIYRDAVKFSAASIIVAHNHPSGNREPSKNDYAITKKIAEAGEAVGIPLLDHLVIGKESYFSMREEGKFFDGK